MGYLIIHIADWLLWTIMAISVCYILLFALASLLPRKKSPTIDSDTARNRFLVLFPAYHEDTVIIHSVETFLQQDYPSSHYQVAVISDHMQPATNRQLSSLPITLHTPSFKESSKAKALQYAISQSNNSKQEEETFDYVVILDADNLVSPNFLSQLNAVCQQGHQAIQCHRTAKNTDNDIAVLDGLSEEINNSIFRKGHNAIGLSSALIGSGMCFSYTWFCESVNQLDSAVEDRELEALLLKQGVFIYYAEHIHVMDEKVSNYNSFQRQRLRWMNGQIQTLCNMLPYVPKAILTHNFNYIDKTIQQALIPRSMLAVFTFILALLITIISRSWSIKWWLLFLTVCLALLLATPQQLRKHSLSKKILHLPLLVWKMVLNMLKIDRKNTDFIHTAHGK